MKVDGWGRGQGRDLLPRNAQGERYAWRGPGGHWGAVTRARSEKKLIDETLRFLARQSVPGETFLETLVRYLATTLGMDFVCIDALEGDGVHARTVAVFHDGTGADTLTYALKDTSCGEVVGKDLCCFSANVCQLFPQDAMLRALGAESFVGGTLRDNAGQLIGLIAVIGCKPLANPSRAEAVLKLVAVRAAGELERLLVAQALAASEKRYALTLAAVNDGLWEWHVPSGKGLFSPRYYEMLGYENGEFPPCYASWRLLVCPYDFDRVEEEWRRSTGQERGFEIDFRLRRKSGEWLWVCARGRAVERDVEGNVLRMLGTLTDISMRKGGEEALRESEKRYRTLFQAAMDGFCLLDMQGRLLEVNETYGRMSGYSLQELLTMGIVDLEVNDTADATATRIRKIVAQGEDRFESQHCRKDGSIFDVEVSVHYLPTEGGRLVAFVRDITERKRVEARLNTQSRNYETYRDILSTTPDGFWLVDFEANILDVNDRYCRQSGYSRQEMLAMRAYDLDVLESPADTAEHIRETMANGHALFETVHRRKDGSTWHVEVSVGASNRAGEQRLVGFMRDITARKEAEAVISRSLQEKEVMLKEIHHRVKNNLQIVHSVLSLQAKRIDDAATRRLFDESLNRVYSMSLIHERLYQAKNLNHIDFKEYLQDLVDAIMASYHCPAVTCAVEMESLFLDVNVGIPCGLIVNELVSNSLKHAFPDGRKGSIFVGIRKNSRGENLLTVEDNGIGLPPAVDSLSNTSLGLQIVRGLTAQIHGTVAYTTVEGARFRVTFPGSAGKHGGRYAETSR